MSTAVENPPQAIAPDVWRPRYNPWAIALTVTMATFMEVLDTSIANVALPHIAGSLSASIDESTWVLTSYLVSNAIILPISAWASTMMGRKRFYMMCVALFGVSSLLCGLAPNLPMLILFRVLQGAGGGGLAPSEQAILADTFPPAKRGMAFAVYGIAVVMAPAIGPTLGGWITDNFDWRWIFFINVPISVISLFLTSRMVEDPPYMEKARKAGRGLKVDYIGLGLIAVGLGSLQVVLDKGQEDDWFSSRFIVVFAILAITGIIGAVIWEYYNENPVLDICLLIRNRTYALACVMMLILGIALFGTTVLLPQLVQTLMGYTAQRAGEALSPGGLFILFLMPFVARLMTKVDPRRLIAFGFLSCSLALFHMTIINLNMDFGTVVILRMLQAGGLAFLFVPINTMSYTGIPPEKNNNVSSMVNLARNVGGSVGISIVTTMLARRSQKHLVDMASQVNNSNPLAVSRIQQLTVKLQQAGFSLHDATARAYAIIYGTMQKQAAMLAYIDTIWVFAIGCGVMIPLAFLMKRSKTGGAVAMH